MKNCLIYLLLFAAILCAEGTRESDSLALVAILDSNPDNTLGWDKTQPIDGWSGVTVTNNRVDTLDISSSKLTSMPGDVGTLSELKYFSYWYNNTYFVPEEIGALSKLEYLNILNNRISELPSEIGGLVSLKTFIANFNWIQELPATVENWTELERFWFVGNYLTDLPDGFTKLDKLNELRFQRNRFKAAPVELADLASLSQLYLDSNEISSIPDEYLNLSLDSASFAFNYLNSANISWSMAAWLSNLDPDWQTTQRPDEAVAEELAVNHHQALHLSGREIHFAAESFGKELTLTDIHGRRLLTEKVSAVVTLPRSLAAGCYFWKLKGEAVQSGAFFIE